MFDERLENLGLRRLRANIADRFAHNRIIGARRRRLHYHRLDFGRRRGGDSGGFSFGVGGVGGFLTFFDTVFIGNFDMLGDKSGEFVINRRRRAFCQQIIKSCLKFCAHTLDFGIHPLLNSNDFLLQIGNSVFHVSVNLRAETFRKFFGIHVLNFPP